MKRIRITLLLVIIAVISASFMMSGQTATESLSLSDKVLVLLKVVTEDEVVNKAGSYQSYSRIFREVAHVVIYGVITLPVFLFLYTWIKRLKYTALLTWILVMLYAVFDEFHQIGVEGRGYEYFDLVMDGIGTSMTIAVASLSIWICKKIVGKLSEQQS